MRKEALTSREYRPLRLLYAAIFLVILVYTFLTPMAADDYSYCYSWADVSRITSFRQIIPSMAVHRQLTNGRVFAHALVQLLLIRPKLLFNLLNALNAVLLCSLYGRFLPGLAPGKKALLLTVSSLLLFNYTGDFQCVFLWLDGSVNYSWGISLLFLFLLPYALNYLGQETGFHPWQVPLFLLLSFVAGAWSENSSLAVLFATALLLLLITLRDRRVPVVLALGWVLALLGYLFLMSAPATAARSGEWNLSALANRLQQMIGDTRENMLVLYALYAVSLVLSIRIKADRRTILLSLILILAGLGSLAAFLFAYYFAARHFCFTTFSAVLAILLLFSELLKKSKSSLPALTAAVMTVVFVFNFAAASLDITVGYGKKLERDAAIRQALDAGEKEITLDVYRASTKYCTSFNLYPDPTQWPNYSVALYYGFDRVIGYFPES